MLLRLLTSIVAIAYLTTGLFANEWDFSKIEFEAGYASGRFISIRDDYARFGFFAPVGINHIWEPFVDTTAYWFKDGKWAASAGLGLRGAASPVKAWGVNAYYDYLRGESKSDFHRIGFGAEWLTPCYDLRINAYIPFCCRTQHVGTRTFVEEDGIFTARRFQYAYTGFDAEIGRYLFINPALSLYLSGGPYYYVRQHFDNFWGGAVSAEVNWRSLVSLQARASYDHVYSINAQAAILITLPLDLFSCFACKYKTPMSQRVRRTGIVLTGKSCCWSD